MSRDLNFSEFTIHLTVFSVGHYTDSRVKNSHYDILNSGA